MRLTKQFLIGPVLMLVLFSTYLSSLSVFLIPNGTLRIVVQAIGIFLFVLLTKRARAFRLKFDVATLMCLIILGLVCLGYAKNDVYRGEFFLYVLSLLFVLVAKDETIWIRPFMGLNILSGLFYVGTTLLMRVSGALYFAVVPRLYPSEHRFSFWYENGFMTGITDHNTTNSCMLAMALIFFVGCWVSSPERSRERIRWLVLSALALVCVILTGKRALLLFPMLALLLTYYRYRSGEVNFVAKYLLLAIGLGVLVLLAYFFVPQVQAVLQRFTNMGEDENILIRYALWEEAMNAFAWEPLMGIGWFGFSDRIAPLVGGRSGHAHNVYIQLLCETGIIGTLVLCGWMLYALLKTMRLLRIISRDKARYPQYIRMWVFVSAAFQLYFAMYCLTENPLYDGFVYPVYYILSMSVVSAYGKLPLGIVKR